MHKLLDCAKCVKNAYFHLKRCDMDTLSGVIFFSLFILNFSAADVKYPIVLSKLMEYLFFLLSLLLELSFLLQSQAMEEVSLKLN